MKRIMSASLLAAFAAALAQPAMAAERRFTVTDFDKIEVQGPFQVELSTGKAPSAVASGSAQAIDRVSIEVQGRTLRVRPNRSAWGGYPGEGAGPLKIAVTGHDLKSIFVNGSGGVSVDKAKAMRFDVSLTGSGRVAIRTVEADNLILGLLGSGQIELGGKAKTLRASVQGSGDLNAQTLVAEDAQITSDTSGRIDVGARRSAKVRATGSGETLVTGDAACTVQALGSGPVRCGKD